MCDPNEFMSADARVKGDVRQGSDQGLDGCVYVSLDKPGCVKVIRFWI